MWLHSCIKTLLNVDPSDAVPRLVLEVTGSSSHLSHCTVGLSGPLFALKVLHFIVLIFPAFYISQNQVVSLATGHPLSLSSLYEVE